MQAIRLASLALVAFVGPQALAVVLSGESLVASALDAADAQDAKSARAAPAAPAAQVPPDRSGALRDRLWSDDPQILAFAFHEIGERRLEELVPDVVQTLGRLRERRESETRGSAAERHWDATWSAAVLLALDALIRCDATVPSTDLRGWCRLEPEYGYALLILAARSLPPQVDVMLELVPEQPAWSVERLACDLVGGAAPELLLEHLLSQIRIVVTAVVDDVAPSPQRMKEVVRGASRGVG